jgi:putative membrane protein insertion efficiency factor
MSPGRLAALVVRGYQLAIRPLLPPTCRFVPGCSDYVCEALERHGALRGGWLGVRRLARCHPWNPGGYDPPPMELERSRD